MTGTPNLNSSRQIRSQKMNVCMCHVMKKKLHSNAKTRDLVQISFTTVKANQHLHSVAMGEFQKWLMLLNLRKFK